MEHVRGVLPLVGLKACNIKVGEFLEGVFSEVTFRITHFSETLVLCKVVMSYYRNYVHKDSPRFTKQVCKPSY